MRGHVRKRGSSWCVVVDVGRLENGRRKQKWHSGFKTRKEAQRALSGIMERLSHGSYIEESKITLAEFLHEDWLPSAKSTTQPSTWESYRINVEKHIVPALGPRRLQRLTPGILNAFYADLLQQGRRDGRGLSPKTVRNIHVILRKALGDAVRWDLVPRNVAALADPPKVKYRRAGAMQTWNADQLRRFLRLVSPDPLYPAFLLAATTGMRRGEILGLRWQDLDLEKGTLSIQQTVILINYEVLVAEPKTARGRRSIALDSQTVATLRSHRARQAEERLAAGMRARDRDLVFAREDGEPIHPERVRQTFARFVRKSDLPPIRFHDLRHTHATLALAAGVHPKVVSERLGHATVAFTMDIYSHAIPALEAKAAQTIADLVFGPPLGTGEADSSEPG